ncbi:hypothetical protein B0E42_22555 [Pseudomonas sp. A25(2017)]|uniref:Uncharacterized protein n=1 Tax=Pseudomonas kilonensis TaxID=132476 RepID=A0ABY0ZIZ4_9PSED|nr:hypothetical protein CFII68_15587 [Pseudomonas sp. CFII68]OOG82101.1 hypothetical protein B0E42_22555 [Pseudomonas sp. A25(2017)]OPG72717.1 hypothetical protein B1219_08730 [Pseudomonas ogarae]SEE79423.1 hypothetical protein SAMN04490188_5762 [Pseudomonas kilonensis]OPG76224.1 hypothetical protein B1218_27230 [Pseudomonas ogarae]
MHAKKIFELLMSLLAYAVVSLLWFAYAVPDMIEQDSDLLLIMAATGSIIWMCATGCIVLYMIQKVRAT